MPWAPDSFTHDLYISRPEPMPDDRLFHKRLGHSQKVNALTSDEEIVWHTYIQAADDFGVMRFSPLPLQDAHERLAKRPQKSVMYMLNRVRLVGLIYVFEHQNRAYCYQIDWQDYQKVRYPLRTVHPRIPDALLAACTLATRWLHTAWPGGRIKLAKWQPPEGWPFCGGSSGNDSGNPSGNNSGNDSGNFPGRIPGDRARGRVARAALSPSPTPTPIPVPEPVGVEPVPPVVLGAYVEERSTAASRRPVENLFKTQTQKTDENTGALPAAQVRGMATALCDREGTAGVGSGERRRGMESPDPRPVGPIGFRGPGPDDAQPCDGGGGADIRETTRPPTDGDLDVVATTPAGQRGAQSRGIDAGDGGAAGARAADPDSNDHPARATREPSESHGGTNSRVADRTGPGGTSERPGGPDLDQNAGGLAAETPGQAELRRTIERLRGSTR